MATTTKADSLIGIRDCGCVTAWISLKHSTKKEVREFYLDMADTGRGVRGVRLDDVRDLIGPCEHEEE